MKPRTAAIMKRGICTFIEKAKTLGRGGADLGLVVNTEDAIVDLPAGKEKTDECTTPFGVMRLSEGRRKVPINQSALITYFFCRELSPSRSKDK